MRGVIGVHSLHLWSLSAPVVCLTVHLTIKVKRDELDFITYTPLSFKICFLLWKLYTKIIGKIQAGWRHRGSSNESRCHGQGQAQDKQNNHSGNILARLPRSREVWFFFILFSRWRLNSRLWKPIALNANLCCDWIICYNLNSKACQKITKYLHSNLLLMWLFQIVTLHCAFFKVVPC